MGSRSGAEHRGGPEFQDWNAQTYTLATIADSVNELIYLTQMINRDPKKEKPKRPEPVYRPDNKGHLKAKRKNQFAAMARAALSAARKRKE